MGCEGDEMMPRSSIGITWAVLTFRLVSFRVMLFSHVERVLALSICGGPSTHGIMFTKSASSFDTKKVRVSGRYNRCF